jgi:hypothetical protein
VAWNPNEGASDPAHEEKQPNQTRDGPSRNSFDFYQHLADCAFGLPHFPAGSTADDAASGKLLAGLFHRQFLLCAPRRNTPDVKVRSGLALHQRARPGPPREKSRKTAVTTTATRTLVPRAKRPE